jgi:ATP-binding cassette subfamily B (MDR/TAP) protein 10
VSVAKDLSGLENFAFTVSGVLLVGAVANFCRVVCFNLAGQRMIARLRKSVFSSIVNQDVAFFDRNRVGELVNRLSVDVEVMSKAFSGTNISAQAGCLTIIGLLRS